MFVWLYKLAEIRFGTQVKKKSVSSPPLIHKKVIRVISGKSSICWIETLCHTAATAQGTSLKIFDPQLNYSDWGHINLDYSMSGKFWVFCFPSKYIAMEAYLQQGACHTGSFFRFQRANASTPENLVTRSKIGTCQWPNFSFAKYIQRTKTWTFQLLNQLITAIWICNLLVFLPA